MTANTASRRRPTGNRAEDVIIAGSGHRRRGQDDLSAGLEGAEAILGSCRSRSDGLADLEPADWTTTRPAVDETAAPARGAFTCANSDETLTRKTLEHRNWRHENKPSKDPRSSALTGFLIALLLRLLPVAVWLDLTNLAEACGGRRATSPHQQRPLLLRLQRRRTGAAHPGETKVVHNMRPGPGRHPDPRDAFAGTRQGHQRTAAEYCLPLRLRLSWELEEPHAASARSV